MKMILMLQDPKRKMNVDDFAEMFGVSRRTIFRDFNALSELQVPVTHDHYSGYGIMPGYKVPPLMFTTRELATIMVGLNFVKSQVDKQLVEDARGVELKIKNVLPEKLKVFMTSLENRTIVDPFLHFGGEKREGGNWYQISSGISQTKRIEFSYRGESDEKEVIRKIDPYLLVFYQDHWNVIGYSHERDAIRNFMLDRMKNIQIMEENFSPDKNLNIEALIFNSGEAGHLIEVLVDSSADRAFRANLPTKIFKEERVSTKKIKVSFFFNNPAYMNSWLLQFGDKVKILSPDSLIGMRKELLNKMISEL
jgi:predicted DNA-binding transcriptional regulator YafY